MLSPQRLFLAALLCLTPVARADSTFGDGPQHAAKTAAMPLLRVDGKRFVNPAGETVVLRGLALSDPGHLKEKGQWGRPYFEAARSWNANVVRIPVHPSYWRSIGEAEYVKMLDDGIRWAAELGMYVIIDWHTIGNPLTDVYHRDMYITDRGETFRFWYTIASRYEKNPAVAAYELFNEPTNRDGRMGRMPWSDYRAYLEELIYMIRRIDERAIILVGGFDYAYDLTAVREDPVRYPGVAYVSHPYPQKRSQPWEPQWERDWGFVADQFPIVATEFGFMSADGRGAHVPVIGDETYGDTLIRYFEQKGISWTAWVFDPHWSPQLVDDWSYTPTRQGRLFREKLQQLNVGASAPQVRPAAPAGK